MDHNGVAFGNQVDLLIRQPHAVHQMGVRPECAQIIQPLNVPHVVRCKGHLYFGPGFGHVDVGTQAPFPGQGIGFLHGFIGTAPGDERPKLKP